MTRFYGNFLCNTLLIVRRDQRSVTQPINHLAAINTRKLESHEESRNMLRAEYELLSNYATMRHFSFVVIE